MNSRVWLALASSLLLGACASSSMHEGMVYRDGSWYSPAGEGRGDYYTASPRSPDAWDYPYDFGIGLVPFGGYCPVRYRYCSSYWGDPFYDAYWYQPWQVWPRHHPPRHREVGEVAPDGDTGPAPARVEPRERPAPRVWEERPVRAPRSSEGNDSPRPRRRYGGTVGGGGG